MIKHLNIKISGLVQGVLFRHSAKAEADKLEISGFVKNSSDGSVYIEAEGEEKALEEFLAWCHQGPNLANVEKVEVHSSLIQYFSSFEIQ